MVIGLLHKYCPFMASMAASDASKLAKLMKAKPFELPVVGSLIIYTSKVIVRILHKWIEWIYSTLGVWRITPNAEKVSYCKGKVNQLPTIAKKDTITNWNDYQQFLVNFWVQVSYENVGTNIQILLMSWSLVDPDWFTIQLDHVHNFAGIVSIIFTQKLNKSVALVQQSDAIFGHVNIHYWSTLDKKLPQERFCHLLIQTTDINRCI